MTNRIDVERGRYWDYGPVVVKGCTKVSPGCLNCWSLPMTRRYQKGQGFVEGDSWTGKIETNGQRLLKVCQDKTPRVISLWNDLFHPDVSDRFLDGIWSLISKTPQHTFLILTKRPERMKWFESEIGVFNYGVLPNIYRGLTICIQPEVRDKLSVFLQIQGKKFLSIEPMLSDISLRWQTVSKEWYLKKMEEGGVNEYDGLREIDAVILGAETGPGARPIRLEWIRKIRNECEQAGVPFFLKHISKKEGRVREMVFVVLIVESSHQK